MSLLFWIAMAVLMTAVIIKLIMIYRENKASIKRVKEMEQEVKIPPTLGIRVGENIESKEKIS